MNQVFSVMLPTVGAAANRPAGSDRGQAVGLSRSARTATGRQNEAHDLSSRGGATTPPRRHRARARARPRGDLDRARGDHHDHRRTRLRARGSRRARRPDHGRRRRGSRRPGPAGGDVLRRVVLGFGDFPAADVSRIAASGATPSVTWSRGTPRAGSSSRRTRSMPSRRAPTTPTSPGGRGGCTATACRSSTASPTR